MNQESAIKKILIAVVIVTFLVALAQFSNVRAMALETYEDASLAIHPSASLAYTYANRHFDASHRDEYDVKRAEALYEKANALNPQLPLLQHQRARIAFLKGDFTAALERIDDEIARDGASSPSSYYVRGLIKGYKGDFAGSASDYETYLKTDSRNWAAINDYAWVLTKENRPRDALVAADWGLMSWPDNPWLLNSKATAHFELGQLALAASAAEHAARAVAQITEKEWLIAYPGNDPLIAKDGVTAFQNAVRENMHTISLALEESKKDVR